MKGHFRTLPGFHLNQNPKQPPQPTLAADMADGRMTVMAGAQGVLNKGLIVDRQALYERGWAEMCARLRTKYPKS